MLFKRLLSTSPKCIGFAFDIDGVLLRGKNPIARAGKALRLLTEAKVPFVLLTNGGGTLEAQRTKFISDALKVDISPLQIIQAHTPYKTMISRYSKILAVGSPAVRGVAEKYGFKDVVHTNDIVRYNKDIAPFSGLSQEQLIANSRDIPGLDKSKFDAVLVFNDPRDWAADLQVVTDLLISEGGLLNTLRREKSATPAVPIYFSCNDLLWANPYQLNRFGQGAFRLLIKTLYSQMNDGLPLNDHILGKPTKLTYDFAHHVLIDWQQKMVNSQVDSDQQILPEIGIEPTFTPFDKVFMVGDNPASDIIGAQNYGWNSCLVRTGVYRDGDHLANVEPTMIVDDVYEGVVSVLNKYS